MAAADERGDSVSPTPEEIAEAALRLFKHPLARRFVQKTVARDDNRIFTAADVLGERLLRIGTILYMAAETPELLRTNTEDADKFNAIAAFANASLTASPYLWSEEVRTSIGKDFESKLPRHVISPKLLPEPAMWWTFETGITVSTQEEHGRKITIDAMLVKDCGESFMVTHIGELIDEASKAAGQQIGRESLPFVDGHVYKYGSTFPDDFSKRDPALASTLALLGFLNSPYIPKKSHRLLRAERRDIKRHGGEAEDEVTFVTLRRPETSRPESDHETSVDWKHTWLVSGHYRAQWYPSEQAHHVIWIAPYLKGPADAPLLTHAYKVAR